MGVSFLAVGNEARDVYAIESTLDGSGRVQSQSGARSADEDIAEIEGAVIEYSRSSGSGRISAGKGAEYSFTKTDWREELPPQRGDRVRFYPSGSDAKDIHSAPQRQSGDAATDASPSLEGAIVAYDRASRQGTISAGRGEDYTFREVDWRSETQPERNMRVSFYPRGRAATDVTLLAMPEVSEVDQEAATRADTPPAEPLDPKVGGLAGVVLSYDPRAERGVITAGRGREYAFTHRDWRSEVPPRRNMAVAFHPAGDRAVDIHLRVDEQPSRVHVAGYIAAYDSSRRRGTVSDNHGRNYAFDYLDWRDDSQPRRGLQVEFLAVGADAKEVRQRFEDQPTRVEGMVAEFNGRSDSGTISDGKGGLYSFTRIDWRGDGQPSRGQGVDFLPAGEEAKDIHLRADVRPERSRMAGVIAEYNRMLGRGRLSDGHGGIYSFSSVHWRGDRDPSRGDQVEFLPFGEDAREVHPAMDAHGDSRQVRDRIAGLVAEYSRILRRGKVSDEHGEIYSFGAVDWRGDSTPKRGDEVTFLTAGDDARAIAPVHEAADISEVRSSEEEPPHESPIASPADVPNQPSDAARPETVEMEGWISTYRRFKRMGIVSTATGLEFDFQLRHWFGDRTPERGVQVTFTASDAVALNIVPVLVERVGTITDYQWMLRRGTIAGDDGRTYSFGRRNWTERENPLPGERVSFSASGDDATVVRQIPAVAESDYASTQAIPDDEPPEDDRRRGAHDAREVSDEPPEDAGRPGAHDAREVNDEPPEDVRRRGAHDAREVSDEPPEDAREVNDEPPEDARRPSAPDAREISEEPSEDAGRPSAPDAREVNADSSADAETRLQDGPRE